MKVAIAHDVEDTRKISFQAEFPVTTVCCRCGGIGRLAFVAHETDEPSAKHGAEHGGIYVSQLHKNYPKGGGFWLHDACCVAVYFCTKCLEPTALYNQA